MRCFFTASLVIASLAGYVYGHRQVAPTAQDEGRVSYRRKSLGFGPEHPHAVFRSSPFQITTNGFTPQDPSMDPMEVARIFVEDVLLGQAAVGSSYKIRSDSYTDKNTGVTHVYVRQLINGLEVTDGDMNINIKDGMVLSYGNSVCSLLAHVNCRVTSFGHSQFFNGVAPEPFSNPAINTLRDPRQEACDQLFQSFTNLQRANIVDSEQIIMGQTSRPDEAIHELQHVLESNCAPVELKEHHFSDDVADFRPALLKFMATATPDPKLALDITDRFEHHRDSMTITPVSHFAPTMGENTVEFIVDSVPDSVNPVKAKLAYIQVPNKANDSTELHLVWKVCPTANNFFS